MLPHEQVNHRPDHLVSRCKLAVPAMDANQYKDVNFTCESTERLGGGSQQVVTPALAMLSALNLSMSHHDIPLNVLSQHSQLKHWSRI